MGETTPISGDIKQRSIRFCVIGPHAEPARDAVQLLLGAPGILSAQAICRDGIDVRYDLRQIGLQIIEESLAEIGFHLDNGLLCRMKRALVYYSEETQLANSGRRHDQANATLDVFIQCYQLRRHGCRDTRPEYLRRYS